MFILKFLNIKNKEVINKKSYLYERFKENFQNENVMINNGSQELWDKIRNTL